jgi:hypothetical protein
MMLIRSSRLGCALAFFVALSAVSVAEDGQPAGDGGRTVVLDTSGFWRLHHTLKPPVIALPGELKPILFDRAWLNAETPPPPDGWAEVDFDDSAWLRGPGRIACRTPYLARLCMRGYFTVTEPAGVKDLALTLTYQGGAVAYLNGKEVARSHVTARAGGDGPLAEGYPAEALLTPGGDLLRAWQLKEKALDAETRRRLALRVRRLDGVRLPASLLRKGLNVLALEFVRAPYHAAVEEHKDESWGRMRAIRSAYELDFNTCEFLTVQLTAAGSGSGLRPNATRRPGVHLWNSSTAAADFDLDWGGQAEPLRPVRIVGARNGAFSGKLVVGSTDPLRGLKVTAGDLASGSGATIPSGAIEVRYALPWGYEEGVHGGRFGGEGPASIRFRHSRYPRPPTLLGMLVDEAPEEFPVNRKAPSRRPEIDLNTPGRPAPVFGAVVPVWITVRVPADAAPGTYTGKATVRLEGGAPSMEAPIELRVADWRLPDPPDYRTWVDLIQSPDTLAVEYGAGLWSEKHWALIERSMRLLGEVGNRVVYVPLIGETNHGNAESMVRWIDRGDGRFDWDFSVMDRYLDLAEKHMGRAGIVVLYAWDIFLAESKQLKPTFTDKGDVLKAREELKGKGPKVTFLDPETGKTENRHLPLLLDPASRPLWKGLFTALRRRMAARGRTGSLMLGTMSDAWPSKTIVEFYDDVCGKLPWFSDSHSGITALCKDMTVLEKGSSKFMQETVYPTVTAPRDEISVLNRAAYSARVWHNTFPHADPPAGSLGGWHRSDLFVQHDRHAGRHPVTRWRHIAEINVTGEQRGVGRLGGDWWRAVKDSRGRRRGTVRQRYPQSSWRNLDANIPMLTAGPDGAVATYRFEIFREGLQECEARIFIERALTAPELKEKLGPELARRCEQTLRRRTQLLMKAGSGLQLGGPTWNYATGWRSWFKWPNTAGHYWFVGSGWQDRSAALYRLAGEVAGKIGDR